MEAQHAATQSSVGLSRQLIRCSRVRRSWAPPERARDVTCIFWLKNRDPAHWRGRGGRSTRKTAGCCISAASNALPSSGTSAHVRTSTPFSASRTDEACHAPPCAVGTPRALSASAMARKLLRPARCTSRMMGTTLVARWSASALRLCRETRGEMTKAPIALQELRRRNAPRDRSLPPRCRDLKHPLRVSTYPTTPSLPLRNGVPGSFT